MASFGIGPSLANYGTRGRSPSLAAFGQSEQAEATGEIAKAADLETKREDENKVAKAQARAGNMQLGATVGGLGGGALAGAQFGSAAGPWGTLIGGLVGTIAGGLFSN